MNKYYSKKQLAKRWGCHITNIDYHAKVGNISGVKVGNKNFYLKKAVEQFELSTNKRIRMRMPKRQLTFIERLKKWLKGII